MNRIKSRKRALTILIVFVFLLGAGSAFAFAGQGLEFVGTATVNADFRVRITEAVVIEHGINQGTFDIIPTRDHPADEAAHALVFDEPDTEIILRYRITNFAPVRAVFSIGASIPVLEPPVMWGMDYLLSLSNNFAGAESMLDEIQLEPAGSAYDSIYVFVKVRWNPSSEFIHSLPGFGGPFDQEILLQMWASVSLHVWDTKISYSFPSL